MGLRLAEDVPDTVLLTLEEIVDDAVGLGVTEPLREDVMVTELVEEGQNPAVGLHTAELKL